MFELSFKNDTDAAIGFYHMNDGGWAGHGRIYQTEVPSMRKRVVVLYKLDDRQDILLFERHLKELNTVSWELR